MTRAQAVPSNNAATLMTPCSQNRSAQSHLCTRLLAKQHNKLRPKALDSGLDSGLPFRLHKLSAYLND